MDTQALIQDAESRIIWGEAPEDVKSYLRENGDLGDAQIEGLIKSFIADRNAHARAEAVKKIVVGSLLLSVPVAYLAFSFLIGVVATKILALTCIPGIYGLIKFSDGLILILRPSSKIDD